MHNPVLKLLTMQLLLKSCFSFGHHSTSLFVFHLLCLLLYLCPPSPSSNPRDNVFNHWRFLSELFHMYLVLLCFEAGTYGKVIFNSHGEDQLLKRHFIPICLEIKYSKSPLFSQQRRKSLPNRTVSLICLGFQKTSFPPLILPPKLLAA